MVIPIDQAVTTFEALISTIKTDYQVYRWVTYLIRQKVIRERLSVEERSARLYRSLDKTILGMRFIYIFLAILSGAVVLSKSYLFIGVALFLLAAGTGIYFWKKKTIAKICSALFSQDFEEFLFSKKTLYQIGEFYSQKYNIPSLVDVIAISDRAIWCAFVSTLFVTCFIYPLNPAYILLCVCAAFYIVRTGINSPFIYKRI